MVKKAKDNFQSRPPVVAVLGHIDHGKTSLLSKIRKRDLTKKETGGITQHIGAYQVEYKGKQITFIDTPGHIAFSKMRSRGAEITDFVVLVVAADDGVMSQTRESLEHIRRANVSFLVAINKIDLPQVNTKKVKEQLQKEGVLVEGFGGDVVCVEVSAKTGQGIDELLEMILLLAEMEELKADSNGLFEAVIIESSLDSRQGPLVTILVKNGVLRTGEEVKAEGSIGKVKAMFDENKHRIKIAGPSKPVEVLGFKNVPRIGSAVVRADKESRTQELGKERKVMTSTEEGTEKKLKIILKSDTQGTLEAVIGGLSKEIKVIFQSVGNVNESDVLLAATTGSDVIGFNVRIPSSVAKLAKTERVKIKSYNIIYQLFDDIKKQIMKPEVSDEILGKAVIIAEFENKKEKIAGCQMKEGKINKDDHLYLKRGENFLGKMKIKSMKCKKEVIVEVKKGDEFGVVFTSLLDFKIGDVIISHKKKNEQ
ncbi:translation initiation factor IF-2 [Candidatus Microgenomates bacterium]|nr:translation initiation factor IF-2 [Candidatus Microgenomates bacterium]